MTNVKDFAKKLLRESQIVLSGQKLGVCEYLPRTKKYRSNTFYVFMTEIHHLQIRERHLICTFKIELSKHFLKNLINKSINKAKINDFNNLSQFCRHGNGLLI